MRNPWPIPVFKRIAVRTAFMILVLTTAFRQNAAASEIDSLYAAYRDAPTIVNANAVFAELFREEQLDTLVFLEESANQHEGEIQLDITMAEYYLSCNDLNSAITAAKRATALLSQDNSERQRQAQEGKNSAPSHWLCVTLGALLLATLISLFMVWRRNVSISQALNNNKHIRSKFITYLSQELREPLLTVMEAGQSLLCDEKKQSHDHKHIGEMIAKHCGAMLYLLNRMDVKPGATPAMQPGDFVYFLRSIVETHDEEAYQRQINLEFRTPLKTLFANYAAEHIRHIVDLLIYNSLAHTDPHGRITVEIPKPNKDRLRFSVTDNGHGIPIENQPYVFTPGHRSRKITKNNKADSEAVINIFQIKRLLDEMGGAVSFSSKPGEGTVFNIDLPFMPDYASVEEHGNATPYIDKWLQQDSGDKANAPIAFIVGNNEDEAFIITRHLIDAFNLRYARDAHEALLNAQGLLPEIIITAAVLPDMDGTQFVRQVRANEALCHIPIVATTSNSSEQERVRFIQAGADALLVKPVSPEEVKHLTLHLVEMRASMREQFVKNNTDKASGDIGLHLSNSDNEFINKAIDNIHSQMAQGKIDLEQMSIDLSLSRKQLRTRIINLTGLTPIAFALQVRLNHAKCLMADTEMSLTMIANKCCFQNLSHFSKAFKQQFGVPPQQFRKSNTRFNPD